MGQKKKSECIFLNNTLKLKMTQVLTHQIFAPCKWVLRHANYAENTERANLVMLKMWRRWMSLVHIDHLSRQDIITGALTSRGPTLAWSHRRRRKTQECGCCRQCRCQCRAESLLLRWEPPPLQKTLRWSSGGCGDWGSDHRWGFHSHSWGWNNQTKNILNIHTSIIIQL